MQNTPEPFDVSTIDPSLEAEISALIPRGGRNPAAAALRRPLAIRDSRDDEPTTGDAQAVETPTGAEDASEAGQAIIHKRQVTHGSFEDNARVSQAYKRMLRAEPGWARLTDVEREVMDMIALKFSRMLSGRSMEPQHWEDVVGYAKLALNQAEGKPCNA